MEKKDYQECKGLPEGKVVPGHDHREYIEVEEIWVPCTEGEGQAVRDGQNLKIVARIANGYPLYLAKDVMLDKSSYPADHPHFTKEH